MFLFSFSVLTLCLAFIFQTALGVELPDPPYDGLWMELNYDRKYMIGYISKGKYGIADVLRDIP